MKTFFKKTILAPLLVMPFTLTAQEQTYSTVKNASIALTAVVQKSDGGTTTLRINNKDILAALNATGVFHFGTNAKLLFRSVEAGLPFFIVSESISNEVTTVDVSDYLTVTEPDDAVHGPNSKVNWGIWNVTLQGDPGTDFSFFGLTTLYTGAIPTGTGGDLLRTTKLNSIGSGPGHVFGLNAQFSGKISGNHGRLE